MSINKLGSKIVVGSIAFAAIMAGGVATLAVSSPSVQNSFSSVRSAIAARDLESYKVAKTQLISDQAKVRTDQVNSTTQDQLNNMADNQAKQTAVRDAIKNADYAKFQANADARLLSKVNDQAAFDKLVAADKARAEHLSKLDEAIKNNDSNAYLSEVKSFGDKILDAAKTENHKMRPQKSLTDDQIKARFDKEVELYKSNGTLPSQRMEGKEGMFDFGGKNGFKGREGRPSKEMLDNQDAELEK